ncbi:CBS domain-containing protein [Desulfarculus baarsii]
MRVRDRMSSPVQTTTPQASVDSALKMMRERDVRHLPVLEQGRLVGLVTDTELRTAWFPSLLDKLSVNDVMVKHPVTIGADETVYQAARLIHHNRITGLPVLDGGKLVGMITQADILQLLIETLGLLDETSRLDVVLSADEGALEQAHAVVAANGGQVISVAQLSAAPARRVYSFRLRQTDVEPIRQALQKAGHQVIS